MSRYSFVQHPASVGETYVEHLFAASGFARDMLRGGIAIFIHALFPFLFVKTGSRIIQNLYERMIASRERGAKPLGRGSDPGDRRRPYAEGGRLVAIMCLAEILCMAGFATYSALLPSFRAAWNFSNTEAGLVGGVLFLGYVVAVPILTTLTDRRDARIVYLASTLIASAGSAAFALLADGFVGALLAQAVFGIGFAGIYMPGLKAMSDRIDESLQSRAVALYTSLSGIGLAGSYFLAGWIGGVLSWRWAFALAAIGPLAAGALVFFSMAPQAPRPALARPGLVAGFRQVFANRSAMAYILGYVAHCWELYGIRAWMVAFLTFVLAGSTAPVALDAPTIASIVSLGGIASSIGCNELVKKLGRMQLITIVMTLGMVLGIATGFSWRLPLVFTLVLLALYYATVMADSGALTAGTVSAARPDQRGMTLGVHSMLGFSAGLVAPTMFGVILDVTGGAASGRAWIAAFIALVAPNAVAMVVMRVLGPQDSVRRDPGAVVSAGATRS